MFLVFLDYRLRYIYMPKLNTSEGNGKQKRRVIRKRLKKESGAECRGDA